jgi:hypothetical protein
VVNVTPMPAVPTDGDARTPTFRPEDAATAANVLPKVEAQVTGLFSRMSARPHDSADGRRQAPRASMEDGSALIPAIIIMAVFTTIIIAILGFLAATDASSSVFARKYRELVGAQSLLTKVDVEIRERSKTWGANVYDQLTVAQAGQDSDACNRAMDISSLSGSGFSEVIANPDEPGAFAQTVRIDCKVVKADMTEPVDGDQGRCLTNVVGDPDICDPPVPPTEAKPAEFVGEGGECFGGDWYTSSACTEAHPLYAIQLTAPNWDALTVVRRAGSGGGLGNTTASADRLRVVGDIRLNSATVNNYRPWSPCKISLVANNETLAAAEAALSCFTGNEDSAWRKGDLPGVGNCYRCNTPKSFGKLTVLKQEKESAVEGEFGGKVIATATNDPANKQLNQPQIPGAANNNRICRSPFQAVPFQNQVQSELGAVNGFECKQSPEIVPEWRPATPVNVVGQSGALAAVRCAPGTGDTNPYDGCSGIPALTGDGGCGEYIRCFEPGIYERRPNLSEFKGLFRSGYRYAWFKPGVYYFKDGLNIQRYPGGVTALPGLDLPIVAGTRAPSLVLAGESDRKAVLNHPPAGRCVLNQPGVQFIFDNNLPDDKTFDSDRQSLHLTEGQFSACPLTAAQASGVDATAGITIYQIPRGNVAFRTNFNKTRVPDGVSVGNRYNIDGLVRGTSPRGIYVSAITGVWSNQFFDTRKYPSVFDVRGVIFMPDGTVQVESSACSLWACNLGLGVVGQQAPHINMGRGLIANAARFEQSTTSYGGGNMSAFSSLPRIRVAPSPADEAGQPGDPYEPGVKEEQATRYREIELTASVASASGTTWTPREKLRMVCGWEQYPLADPYRPYNVGEIPTEPYNPRVRPDGSEVNDGQRNVDGTSTCISTGRKTLFEGSVDESPPPITTLPEEEE